MLGWNPRATTRFSFYSGLAISRDGGNLFTRYSRAPILERTDREPFVNASPMVIRDGKLWRMYYVSGEGWIHPDLPRYNIKYAESDDGRRWRRDGHACVDFASPGEHALARPCVVKDGRVYRMWFAFKGANYDLQHNYRIGYAEFGGREKFRAPGRSRQHRRIAERLGLRDGDLCLRIPLPRPILDGLQRQQLRPQRARSRSARMTTVAIMQPTYLPWLGYFALMDRVDTFVYLDSVQFARRSWQQRNRIKSATGEMMLTIPVAKKGLRDQKIADVEILYGPEFPRRHIDILAANYRRAEFFDTYAPPLYGLLETAHRKLADLTIAICEWLAEVFGITARRIRSVTMDNAGAKADLLVHLCRQLDATRYISPVGSHDYLAEFDAFAKAGIELYYHGYEHPTYPQLYGPFLPFMGAIDLLAECRPGEPFGNPCRPTCDADGDRAVSTTPTCHHSRARGLKTDSGQEYPRVLRTADDRSHPGTARASGLFEVIHVSTEARRSHHWSKVSGSKCISRARPSSLMTRRRSCRCCAT